MKITPLTHLACMRIPALTDIFSDLLTTIRMDVVAGGQTEIVCGTPHGIPVGTTRAVAIIDALTPNAIVGWEVFADGDVRIVTEYQHDLTGTPDATMYEGWSAFATLAGTGVVGLDGNKQLVSVDTPTSFVVRPGGLVSLPPTVPAGAAHLARIERQLTGWHNATAASTTILRIETPNTVVRDYTVDTPKIATNIRVWGAVDLESALAHFSRENESEVAVEGRGWLFVCPIEDTRMSRDPASKSDATAEIMPSQVVRQHLIDGFVIYAVLPSERSGGGVACVDKAQGTILRAVMRTFNGLRLPYTEFALPDPFVSILIGHGREQYTRANYVHRYTFEATVLITDQDCAPPNEIPDLVAFDAAIVAGTSPPLDPIQPVGSVPFADVSFGSISFDPDPQYGIFQSDKPQPLIANISLPPA